MLSSRTAHGNVTPQRRSRVICCQVILMQYMKVASDERLRPLGLRAKGTILDIGCQSGSVCAELQRLGYEPSGIEIDSRSVEDARTKHPGISFAVGNCEKEIPFPDNCFDFAWAGEVIEHVGHTDGVYQ